LAPTLFGQTEEARSIKSAQASRSWDRASFFQELASRSTPEVVNVAQGILSWMEKNASRVVYGHGRIEGSITSFFLVNGVSGAKGLKSRATLSPYSTKKHHS